MGQITFDTKYKEFSLNHSMENNEGFYIDMLDAIRDVFISMSQKRKRIFFTMFVIKFPSRIMDKEQMNNRVISEFMEKLIMYCEDMKYSAKYLWAREKSSTGQVHYHLMLLLDSNRIQNAWSLINIATQIWGDCLGGYDAKGLVHLCTYSQFKYKYGGMKVFENSPSYFDDLQSALGKASYLAKVYSKEATPFRVRRYGKSINTNSGSNSQFAQHEIRFKYR